MSDEARAVIGKARRSFGFSMSILILGFMAIVLALVYRATRDGGSIADRYVLESIAVPAGADVLSVLPSGDIIALTYVTGGETFLRMVDAKTGAVLREIPVIDEIP